MASNKNIFFATNPAHTIDALWQTMSLSNVLMQDMLIFLPSRRAIRSVEKMIVEKSGGATMLPELVALGEGIEDETIEDENISQETISNIERVVVLAKLLSADKHINNISTALPIAHDLVRMTDYFENEGIDISQIPWATLINDQYAEHFHDKAKILQILSDNIAVITHEKQTISAKRNSDIRAWIPYIKSDDCKYKLIIVCGSTASVPATADLMATVATLPFGRIILSGKISGRVQDFELPTNPYYSEYKFLSRIGCDINDIIPIDVGNSNTIDFMNYAFGNETEKPANNNAVSHCHLIECEHESMEAFAVAEIVSRAIKNKKSVLVITPDSAGNQRISSALAMCNISADFSSGRPATMHIVGRAILNLFDDWIEHNKTKNFDDLYKSYKYDLFEMLVSLVCSKEILWTPEFNPLDEQALPIWNAIKDMSDAILNNGILLTLSDARAFIADTLSSVVIRPALSTDTKVCVLGTIESRMQTADIVILTGLNEDMFPSRGYQNAWLPRKISEQLGLPSPDRKVSLMSLDFMNLSCSNEVYWLRSKISGGVQTTESRFISRIVARGGNYDLTAQAGILSTIHARNNIPLNPLNYDAPTPPTDWSDIYVTELEYLIHNPYAFYVRHILRLKKQDDYWVGPDARAFGNLIHDVIEHARPDDSPNILVARMDSAAREKLGSNGVLFHFWHKRFMEIAPVIANEISSRPDAYAEIPGHVKLENHIIRARADRVCDGIVIDIKTGAAPTLQQLQNGTMPQLPLEALMLQSGGFAIPTTTRSKTPVMMFLQLRNNDVRQIVYDSETTSQMIHAAVDKAKEVLNIFYAGGAPYENRPNADKKYRTFDDLARTQDNS